jgi:hypothetical protein
VLLKQDSGFESFDETVEQQPPPTRKETRHLSVDSKVPKLPDIYNPQVVESSNATPINSPELPF